MDKYQNILKRFWGYDSFRSLQEDIIRSVCSGKDTLGLMPTGGGKSLTFQVSALAMEGICIVVTPLIALMKDQVDGLKEKGIKATAVYSGMRREEIIINLENCIFGDYKFLYVSPERLSSPLFLEKIQYMKVCLLAVDESHCISQWGYDFRPSYLKIADLRKKLPKVPVLALTATATSDVVDDIQNKLDFKEKNVFQKSFERKNIAYVVRNTEDKLFETVHILEKIQGSSIVYVRNRKQTKKIANELNRRKIKASFFHAGLDKEIKEVRQNKWKTGDYRVIVCTNAFGMGIDKADVRSVIHYEIPSSIEEYFQEAGRVGRDGKKAYAIVLKSERDTAKLKRRISEEFPGKNFVKGVYEKLSFYYQIAVGSGIHLSRDFNIEDFCKIFKFNIVQVHSALKLLDMAGYLEYQEEENKQSRIIFTVKRDDLYKYELGKDTEKLITILLRSYSGLFSDFVYIKENLLAQRTELNQEEIYNILKTLTKQKIVYYVPAKKTPTIVYLQNREETDYIAIPQYIYEERKEKLTNRIDKVITYLNETDLCRSRYLLDYFGEKGASDCNQCDICLLKKKKELGKTEYLLLKDKIKNIIYDSKRDCPVNKIIAQLSEQANENHVVETIRLMADKGEISLIGDCIRAV